MDVEGPGVPSRHEPRARGTFGAGGVVVLPGASVRVVVAAVVLVVRQLAGCVDVCVLSTCVLVHQLERSRNAGDEREDRGEQPPGSRRRARTGSGSLGRGTHRLPLLYAKRRSAFNLRLTTDRGGSACGTRTRHARVLPPSRAARWPPTGGGGSSRRWDVRALARASLRRSCASRRRSGRRRCRNRARSRG